MASLFLSHGGPNIVTDDSAARDFLKSLPAVIGRPKAIVIASAHFEEKGAAVVSDPAPEMIYDFGGFAPELYEMVYPAPGDPALAEKVASKLESAGIAARLIGKRGYDHGVWTPLLLAFPDADIPVVQLSIDPERDAEYHYRLGEAVAALAEEGVLIIGSGHITHNLAAVFGAMRGGARDPGAAEKVEAFTGWLAEKLMARDTAALLDWREAAPFAKENHPSAEHLMPLFFAYGAGGAASRPERIHASRQYGFFAFDAWLFEPRKGD